jgi:hypothetical protein
VRWTRAQPAGAPALGKGSVNLRGRFGVDEQAVAYAKTTLTADRARTVTLYTGSDDTISVWLNGKLLLAKDVYRGAAPDQERVDLPLRPGANTLLVKICQTTGGWEFFARLGDEFGVPVTAGITCGTGP